VPEEEEGGEGAVAFLALRASVSIRARGLDCRVPA